MRIHQHDYDRPHAIRANRLIHKHPKHFDAVMMNNKLRAPVRRGEGLGWAVAIVLAVWILIGLALGAVL